MIMMEEEEEEEEEEVLQEREREREIRREMLPLASLVRQQCMDIVLMLAALVHPFLEVAVRMDARE